MAISSTQEIIADLRAGRMVIMLDDAERENEGDLIMAAELVRPADINFMTRYGRGLVCLTLTRQRCQQLHLPLMVEKKGGQAQATYFTLSIEAADGVTTGISAEDRATTVQAAINPDATPYDLTQPGHVFPVMAQPGGTLTRAGHTEAGCDLAGLAGMEPASVIVEVLNDDGSMARLPDLERFSDEHSIKLGTIEDLIKYRIAKERTVTRVAQTMVETEFGPFMLYCFEDGVDTTVHFALVRGPANFRGPTLVRVHVSNTLSDTLSIRHGNFGWPLRDALARIAEEGSGVVVVLRGSESAAGLVRHVTRLEEADDRVPQPETTPGIPALRTYGVGAQILSDLGVQKMRVLAAPMSLRALSGFDLEVVEYVEG